ncbi:MAG: ATP-dependent transcriptional regulator [Cypionkella sp.]|nr:ATP-dependent transcriptional regulator [Cypionkella sp.]
MRLLPLIAVLGLSACMSAPQAQVSKNYTEASTNGLGLPTMQNFAAVAATRPTRSNAEIAHDFLNLEFRMESGRAIAHFSRFDGPITVQLNGDVPTSANAEMSRVINRLRDEAGLPVSFAKAGDNPSITIEFQPRAQMVKVVPMAACFVVPRVQSWAEYKAERNGPKVDWTTMTSREHVAIFVPSDAAPQEIRDCLNEETAQALGPLNDLYQLTDSVFNDDNFNSVLTGSDMLTLRVHYAPELRNGMNEAEAAKYVPGVLARLNPAGNFSGRDFEEMAPRSWVAAVEGAFGPRGGAASRLRASDLMLSIALAQGWHDSRLAFSYYAKGRSMASAQPAEAVAALSKAAAIYRSIPGAQVHVAHVDMQLAAIALAAGQPGQAIAFSDRAIPVAKRAENASLLATLMLIKAEAMQNTGRVDEAKVLRLDSLGWARYGFGSERQVRARMAEISNLGAQGRRG